MADYLEYNWVMPNLAQGAYPEPPAAAFKEFDILVLCAKELQCKSLKAPTGKYLVRMPMVDDTYRPIAANDAARYQQLARELAKAVMRGKKVLITCAQGVNRSGVITSLTILNMTKLRGRDVVKLLRQNRKPPRSADGSQAYPLMNPLFESFIVNARP